MRGGNRKCCRKMKIRCGIITILTLIAGGCGELCAEDEGSKEPKGLDVVSDVAVTLIKKTNAFFQGNLEITMPPDVDSNKNKDNYSSNAIGQRVPKATNTKNPAAVHND